MVVVVEDMGLFDEIPTRDYALFRTYNLKRATRNIQSIIGHSSSPHSARLFIYVEWPMVNDAVIDVSLSLRLASLSAALVDTTTTTPFQSSLASYPPHHSPPTPLLSNIEKVLFCKESEKRAREMEGDEH